MKNICYIISGIDKAMAFEWIADLLDKNKYKIHFVLLHDRKGGLEEYLIANNIPHCRIHYKSKAQIFQAVSGIYRFLKSNKILIVHCHLLDAGFAGIIASRLSGIKTRIYTRHYSTYHHVYFPKGIWYDKVINRISTRIIAVSKVVKEVLVERENVDPEKIEILHHGFPLSDFDAVTDQKIEALKEKYKIRGKHPVIGVVSRYTEWKGIQYIIPAFKEVLTKYPDSHLVLANAKGSYQTEIQQLLSTIPETSFTEIVFEDDLFTLFKSFGIFVHVPVDSHSEAFGQVYIEAMAAEKPCIFTLSGIAGEIVVNNHNAIEVPYQNSQAIAEAILKILETETGKQLGKNAKISVQENFQLKEMISRLEQLYA